MANYSAEVKGRLNDKLVAVLGHLRKVEADKKAEMEGYNEQIKRAKEKINALTQALATEDFTHLSMAFSDDERRALGA